MKNPERLLAWGGGWVSLRSGLGSHFRRRMPSDRLGYLTAASLLLRCRALEDVGLFDEGFFMYWEDVDLCLRLRWAGWTLAVVEDAVVNHKEGASFGDRLVDRDRIVTRSDMRFFRKHAARPWAPIVVRECVRILIRLSRLEFARVRAVCSTTIRAWRVETNQLRKSGRDQA